MSERWTTGFVVNGRTYHQGIRAQQQPHGEADHYVADIRVAEVGPPWETVCTVSFGYGYAKELMASRLRQILAAPDLLSALRVARGHLRCKVTGEWLDPATFDTSCHCVSCEDSRTIEAAIANAEGR